MDKFIYNNRAGIIIVNTIVSLLTAIFSKSTGQLLFTIIMLSLLVDMYVYLVSVCYKVEAIPRKEIKSESSKDYYDGFSDGAQAALDRDETLPEDYLARPMQYQIGFKDAYLNHFS